MSDSNKLPTIEVGDTVVFRTDLVDFEYYGFIPYNKMESGHKAKEVVCEVDNDGDFTIRPNGWWHSPQMVKEVIKPSPEVIKPTKERMYSEIEMEQCWKAAIVSACSVIEEDPKPMQFKDFIQSLNTEGK